MQSDGVGLRGGCQEIAIRGKGNKCTRSLISVRERAKQSPARDIPQVYASIEPAHGQASASGREADIQSAHRPIGERDEGAAPGQLPKITPPPAAEVFFAGLR